SVTLLARAEGIEFMGSCSFRRLARFVAFPFGIIRSAQTYAAASRPAAAIYAAKAALDIGRVSLQASVHAASSTERGSAEFANALLRWISRDPYRSCGLGRTLN